MSYSTFSNKQSATKNNKLPSTLKEVFLFLTLEKKQVEIRDVKKIWRYIKSTAFLLVMFHLIWYGLKQNGPADERGVVGHLWAFVTKWTIGSIDMNDKTYYASVLFIIFRKNFLSLFTYEIDYDMTLEEAQNLEAVVKAQEASFRIQQQYSSSLWQRLIQFISVVDTTYNNSKVEDKNRRTIPHQHLTLRDFFQSLWI